MRDYATENNKIRTEEVLFFVVWVHFLVLVRNPLLLEDYPTPLNIGAELTHTFTKSPCARQYQILLVSTRNAIPIQTRTQGPEQRCAALQSSLPHQ